MNQVPREIGSDQDDPDEELTRLEWTQSQRTLTPDEQQRLTNLRGQGDEIKRAVQDRIAPPDSGNPVISGDDSP